MSYDIESILAGKTEKIDFKFDEQTARRLTDDAVQWLLALASGPLTQECLDFVYLNFVEFAMNNFERKMVVKAVILLNRTPGLKFSDFPKSGRGSFPIFDRLHDEYKYLIDPGRDDMSEDERCEWLAFKMSKVWPHFRDRIERILHQITFY